MRTIYGSSPARIYGERLAVRLENVETGMLDGAMHLDARGFRCIDRHVSEINPLYVEDAVSPCGKSACRASRDARRSVAEGDLVDVHVTAGDGNFQNVRPCGERLGRAADGRVGRPACAVHFHRVGDGCTVEEQLERGTL